MVFCSFCCLPSFQIQFHFVKECLSPRVYLILQNVLKCLHNYSFHLLKTKSLPQTDSCKTFVNSKFWLSNKSVYIKCLYNFINKTVKSNICSYSAFHIYAHKLMTFGQFRRRILFNMSQYGFFVFIAQSFLTSSPTIQASGLCRSKLLFTVFYNNSIFWKEQAAVSTNTYDLSLHRDY